jgi:hypothetical protein
VVYLHAVPHVLRVCSYSSDFSVWRFSSICTGHFTSLQNSLRLYSVKFTSDIFSSWAILCLKLISIGHLSALFLWWVILYVGLGEREGAFKLFLVLCYRSEFLFALTCCGLVLPFGFVVVVKSVF